MRKLNGEKRGGSRGGEGEGWGQGGRWVARVEAEETAAVRGEVEECCLDKADARRL